MKYCNYCGKELKIEQRHNIYCSTECATKAKRDNKIKDWLDGKFNGLKADNTLSNTIRNYLLEKANYKCEKCGWGEVNPTTGKVPLEIHHEDGNYLNNKLENLKVLCPNCHSLTPNYKALNRSDRERGQTRKQYCIDCGIEVSYGAIRCKTCENKKRITTKPVTREELKDLIRTETFVSIGKKFNVSDNAIKKWCIQYQLPSKKRDINKYSSEEWANI